MTNNYEKISDAAYHALPLMSQSKLKHYINHSSAQAVHQSEERKQTSAMSLGTMIHNAILSDWDFTTLEVLEKLDGRTKAGKEQADSIKGRSDFLWKDDFDIITNAKQSFNAFPEAVKLLKRATYIEHYGEVSLDGIDFKFKPDIVWSQGIVDIKTIGQMATRASIRQAMSANNYSYQLAAYRYFDSIMTGTFKPHGTIVWIETVAPYGVYITDLSEGSLGYGFEEFSMALQNYNEYKDSGFKLVNNGFIQDPFI
jgi:hypothetical protein